MSNQERKDGEGASGGYLTRDEACAYLGFRKSKLNQLAGREIPYYQVGRQRFYDPKDLDEFVASKFVPIYRETKRRRRH